VTISSKASPFCKCGHEKKYHKPFKQYFTLIGSAIPDVDLSGFIRCINGCECSVLDIKT